MKYQNFVDGIKNLINESNLDIGAVYYILKDIYRDIEILYYKTMANEMRQNIKKEEDDQVEA